MVAVCECSELLSSQSEDRDDAVVLRLYEAFGGRANAVIRFGFPVKEAYL